jgi:flagellar biogenesis protein FliO
VNTSNRPVLRSPRQPHHTHWERRRRSADRPAARRIHYIVTLLVSVLICLGLLFAPAGRIANAAAPVTTPPALPSAGVQQTGAAIATPPALPVGNPPRAAAGNQQRAAHGSSPDAAPLHLPAYTPAGAGPDTTLSGASLLGLLAKFVAVLVLLFIALRILRAVMPRLQGGGGSLTPGGMVLYNEALGDKKRACLLDLGDRVVLVGIGTTDMSPLATVDDPTEVAALRARYGPRTLSTREQGMRPTFTAALKEAVTRTTASGSGAKATPAIPKMGAMSDVTYIQASAHGDMSAELDALQTTAREAAGSPDARIGGALERMRQLREKIGAL